MAIPEKKLESALPQDYGKVLLQWQALEHDPFELGPHSRIITVVLLIAIIAYALFTDSPLMAIVFILVGVIGYLSLHREPREISFFVTTKGIACGNQFYEFDNIESFHLYKDVPFENLLSIKTNGRLVSHVHIPIHTISKETLYDTLSQYIPEDKHEPSLVDTLEKLLHI